jgi:hypothetical protein
MYFPTWVIDYRVPQADGVSIQEITQDLSGTRLAVVGRRGQQGAL